MPPHDWKAKTGISTVAERVEKKYKKRKEKTPLVVMTQPA
jgi:hypothetical protein